jgi:hypothetical protein
LFFDIGKRECRNRQDLPVGFAAWVALSRTKSNRVKPTFTGRAARDGMRWLLKRLKHPVHPENPVQHFDVGKAGIGLVGPKFQINASNCATDFPRRVQHGTTWYRMKNEEAG